MKLLISINKTINMKSKKIILIIAIISSFWGCSRQHQITGSSNIVSEIRNLDSFNEVTSMGPYKITITKGKKQNVEIFANDNIIKRIKTNVSNGRLTIRSSSGNYTNISVEVHITVVDLNKIENYSSGAVYIDHEMKSFNAINLSSGNIHLEGSCTNLNIQNYSSGNFLAYNMLVENCSVTNSSSGNIKVNCKSKLNVSINSSGNVYYKGEPSMNISISSSGNVYNDN
jgi:formylmethanofuran dehydrogenase subunit C